jgi:uncharacterized membrane protein YcaP (DUF421 family)
VTLIVALAPVTATRVGEQALKTLIIVIVLLVGFRITGKRELAQFNVYDLAMIMALSNAVQNAMTGGLGNLPIGLATSSTVVVAAWGLSRLLGRRPALETRFLGSPTLLVHDGRVLTDRLRRQHVSMDELREACRQRGMAQPQDCRLVMLEIDGSLSVVPFDAPVNRVDPEPRRKAGRRPRR